MLWNLFIWNLSISIPSAVAGSKYYLAVDEAVSSPFSAGAYQLRVLGPTGSAETVTLGGTAPLDDNSSNENFLSATRLSNIATNGRTEYRVFAELRQGGDSDVYKVRAPYPGLNQSNVLTATVVAFVSNLAPKIIVTNSLGLPVNATITADYTVQVNNASAGADYLIAVSSRTGQLGDYSMRTTFRSIVTKATAVESGLLTALKKEVNGTLEITGSAQIYFRLSSTLSALLGPSVKLQVIDSYSRVRLQLLAQGGDTVEGVALLGPGSYRIRISGNGTFLPLLATDFALQMSLLTDPIGTTPSDPNETEDDTTSPPPPPPSSAKYKDSKDYYTWGESTPTIRTACSSSTVSRVIAESAPAI